MRRFAPRPGVVEARGGDGTDSGHGGWLPSRVVFEQREHYSLADTGTEFEERTCILFPDLGGLFAASAGTGHRDASQEDVWDLVREEFASRFAADRSWALWLSAESASYQHAPALRSMPRLAAKPTPGCCGAQQAAAVTQTQSGGGGCDSRDSDACSGCVAEAEAHGAATRQGDAGGCCRPTAPVSPHGHLYFEEWDEPVMVCDIVASEDILAKVRGRAPRGAVVEELSAGDEKGMRGFAAVMGSAFRWPTAASFRAPITALLASRDFGPKRPVEVVVARDEESGRVVGGGVVVVSTAHRASGIFEVRCEARAVSSVDALSCIALVCLARGLAGVCGWWLPTEGHRQCCDDPLAGYIPCTWGAGCHATSLRRRCSSVRKLGLPARGTVQGVHALRKCK